MNLRTVVFLIVAAVLIAAIAITAFPLEEKKEEKVAQHGFARALEFGRAGNYGYLTFYYNGTGNFTLLALSEQPKSKIIVLKKDFLNTERYPYFIKALAQLGKKGFSITEVDSIAAPENSIIIIPSGAMPSGVLERLDNLTQSNEIIYVGKRDLVFSERDEALVRTDWLQDISNSSKEHIIVMDKTLGEFHADANLSLFDVLERNSWAERNSVEFEYEGEGKKTAFLMLRNASWLRMLPSSSAATEAQPFPLSQLADSHKLLPFAVQMSGTDNIFPGQKAYITLQLNYSEGIARYSLEKEGAIVQQDDLARVRGEEAFFLSLSFPGPGDYLLRVSDYNGTIGAMRIHVKDLNISLSRTYGNSYEFTVLLDNEPVESTPATVGLAHSGNTLDAEVKRGKMTVLANLRQGENVFVITIMGQKVQVPYSNSSEGLLAFYAKYLTIGTAMVALFYVAARLKRKPVYKINIPESVPGQNPEVKIKPADVVSAIEEVEKRFGWKGVPLYAKEIRLGLKSFTGGMEVTEGNIEAVMKKLVEKGTIKHHLALYGLSQWGDAKENALRRIVRDKLIEQGIGFSEIPEGFECGERRIMFDPESPGSESIAIFEDREEMRTYLQSLEERKRARLEVRLRNGAVRLATLDSLDELL